MGLYVQQGSAPHEDPTDKTVIQDFDLHKSPQTRQRPGERPATTRQVRKLRKLSKAYDPTPITEDDAERLTRDVIAIELQRLEILERPTRAIKKQRAAGRRARDGQAHDSRQVSRRSPSDVSPSAGLWPRCWLLSQVRL